ncbi:hypothetical protein I3760_03G168900 [Carya illinoinensis]|nr:hypothetical protein I3760_03G168900 [Carya illinoinensis]
MAGNGRKWQIGKQARGSCSGGRWRPEMGGLGRQGNGDEDGLKKYDQSIARIREAMKYEKSSPQMWNTFKQYFDSENITCKSSVCLDVPTRWNSTYMMLDRAEKFQKAFQRLEDEDSGYVKSI